MLDIFFGLTEVVNYPKNRRIDFYGKAGIHRPTSYGVEHKTSSNYWMGDRDKIGWAFETAIAAVNTARQYKQATSGNGPILSNYKSLVVGVRNSWDKREASHILSNFAVPEFPRG
jgi:hypothetical protein